jgi:hypothetical protein
MRWHSRLGERHPPIMCSSAPFLSWHRYQPSSCQTLECVSDRTLRVPSDPTLGHPCRSFDGQHLCQCDRQQLSSTPPEPNPNTILRIPAHVRLMWDPKIRYQPVARVRARGMRRRCFLNSPKTASPCMKLLSPVLLCPRGTHDFTVPCRLDSNGPTQWPSIQGFAEQNAWYVAVFQVMSHAVL